MVYVPVMVVMIWIVIPAFYILTAVWATKIVGKVCIPVGYSSVYTKNAIVFVLFFVGYLLPLALMIFFYSRIIRHALRTKVTNRYHHA